MRGWQLYELVAVSVCACERCPNRRYVLLQVEVNGAATVHWLGMN